MKRDFLAKMGLDENMIEAVMREHGADIERVRQGIDADGAAAFDELESTKQQLSMAQSRIAELQADAERSAAEYSEQTAKLRVDAAVESVLRSARARNINAAKALLDMDALSYDEQGLSGLDEQVAAMKTECAYLFDTDAPRIVAVEKSAAGMRDTRESMIRAAMGLGVVSKQ